MEAKELRIGNWYRSVKFNTDVQCTLEDFYNLCAMSEGATDDPPISDMFEPIQLTEEWLLKLGFQYLSEGYWYKGLIQVGYTTTDQWLQYEYLTGVNSSHTEMLDLKYVHQLQNLFFALSGKELEIKKSELVKSMR